MRMGDTIVHSSVKRDGMYMHIGSGTAETEGDIEEVNLFDQATRFQVVPVAKHWMQTNENNVRAGSFVKLFQRQSETYVYRDHMLNRSEEGRAQDRQVVLFAPHDEEDKDEVDQIAGVVLRVDLLWQLNRPTMKWSGASMQYDARGAVEYSLRDAVSGQYLAADDRRVFLADNDKAASAHWYMRPHAAQSGMLFVKEITGFYIEVRLCHISFCVSLCLSICKNA